MQLLQDACPHSSNVQHNKCSALEVCTALQAQTLLGRFASSANQRLLAYFASNNVTVSHYIFVHSILNTQHHVRKTNGCLLSGSATLLRLPCIPND